MGKFGTVLTSKEEWSSIQELMKRTLLEEDIDWEKVVKIKVQLTLRDGKTGSYLEIYRVSPEYLAYLDEYQLNRRLELEEELRSQ